MSGIEWWLELGLVGLLALTLVHAVRLERALNAMRRDRGELEGLLQGLDEASRQALGGVDGLRASADQAARSLVQRTETADTLRGDLTYLIERAESTADRLEALVRVSRTPDAAPARPAPAIPDRAEGETGLRSQAERDLLKALRGAR